MENHYKTIDYPVKILTDFLDYYDDYFQPDSDMLFLTRMTSDKIDREKRLRVLKEWEIRTVPFGMALELLEALPPQMMLPDADGDIPVQNIEAIVYLDESSSVGEGAVKMSLLDAAESFPDSFATLFVESREGEHAVSFRYVRVGRKEFWLKNKGLDNFRSNRGNPTCEIMKNDFPKANVSLSYSDSFPTCVIDFVMSEGGELYAVDFSPIVKFKGTPIEKVLPAEEAAFQIKSWLLTSIRMKELAEELGIDAEMMVL